MTGGGTSFTLGALTSTLPAWILYKVKFRNISNECVFAG